MNANVSSGGSGHSLPGVPETRAGEGEHREDDDPAERGSFRARPR